MTEHKPVARYGEIFDSEEGWSRRVLERISAIGVTFPAYINHPLVDLIKSEQAKRKEAAR